MENHYSKGYQTVGYIASHASNMKKAVITGLALIILALSGCQSVNKVDTFESDLRRQEERRIYRQYGDIEHPPIELRF